MKHLEKIKTYKEIKQITQSGEKTVLRSTIVYKFPAKELGDSKIRIGILTSKKFGNAVKRNFAKRRITAVLNQVSSDISKAFDVVFIPRNKLTKMVFEDMQEEIKKILS